MPLWAGIAALLIGFLPMLAGLAILRRRRAAGARGFNAGPISASLWALWLLAATSGIMHDNLLSPGSIWVSLALFAFTLWDWAKSLRGMRPRVADFGVMVMGLALVILMGWGWLNQPEALRPLVVQPLPERPVSPGG